VSAQRRLTEEEAYLAALLQDDSGIEMSEFLYKAEFNDDGCYRLRPYQYYWWWFKADKKMNACARDVGKTEHMVCEASAFPYAHAGYDYFLTAPGQDHLRPIVDKIEQRILSIRILRELLISRNGKNGISRIPSFQAEFRNGSKIITRIPKQDGKGVKGQHALRVRVEEGQDYPEAGWNELFPTLRKDLPGANMSVYGVTAGTANRFDEFATDPDTDWTVFRKIAPERPGWGEAARHAAIKEYKGETSIDYGRNIFGISTGVHSNWYVTARLMAAVRVEESPWAIEYNRDVYRHIDIDADDLSSRRARAVDQIEVPASHLGAQYTTFWAGYDVGLTTDPSEILVFGQYELSAKTGYRLLMRVSMSKISAGDQIEVVKKLCISYGHRFRRLAMDGTGLGLPIYQILATIADTRDIVRGYGFSEKLTVGWEDRKLAPKEKLEDLEIKKRTPDHGLDVMREFVDNGQLELPMDVPLLTEWQGIGEDHTLHAGWLFGVAVRQHEIDAKKDASKQRTAIIPAFG
jgi:hypothetical protein